MIRTLRSAITARSLKANIVASFFGKAWTALLGLALVPVYVHYLGIEAYGVAGVFITLTTLTAALDMGLSTTLNRELAIASAKEGGTERSHDLLLSLEIPFWILAITVAATIFCLAPWLGTNWLKPQALSLNTTINALMLLAFAVLLQWPQALYGGGLMGLQKHVAYNTAQVIFATIRVIGAVVVLAWVSPSITAFLVWHIVVSSVQTIVLAVMLHSALFRGVWPNFRFSVLQRVGGFSVGVFSTSLAVLCLTTLDKVILSKLLSLEEFGYYMFANTLAAGLTVIVIPVYQATFPKLSALVESGDKAALNAAYHRCCQLITVLITPIAFVAVAYAEPLLEVWTQNTLTADRVHVLLSVLTIGNVLNGLLSVPNGLMLAQGWTKWVATQNIVASLVIAPTLLWTVPLYGGIAAALLWGTINATMIFTLVVPHHLRRMPGQIKAWFIQDTIVPACATISISGIGYVLIYSLKLQFSAVSTLAIASIFALGAMIVAALAAPLMRPYLLGLAELMGGKPRQ